MAARGQPTKIALAGLIGAGKTTLAAKLAKSLNYVAYYEDVENPVLTEFYKDMAANSFTLQIDLLHRRYNQALEMQSSRRGSVQDRSIYEDAIFARMLMDSGLMRPVELDLYMRFSSDLLATLPRPSVIVYLDAPPEVCLARIKQRGRRMETGITLEYLQRLRRGYEDWVTQVSREIPVIRIDWSNYCDEDAVAQAIVHAWSTISSIHTVEVKTR